MERNSQKNPGRSDNLTGKAPPSLLELSANLKTMFEMNINSDFTLTIGKRVIPCHRAILKFRSKWFHSRIDDTTSEPITSIEMNENEQLLNAVLIYLYTGNLCLIEDLKVPLACLHEAAYVYGLHSLKSILTKTITSIEIPGVTATQKFWTELEFLKGVESVGPILLNLSLDDTDTWYVRMGLIHTPESSNCRLYMKRCTKFAIYQTHIVKFETHILNSFEERQISFYGVNIYKTNCEKEISESVSVTQMVSNGFLSNNTLSVISIFTVSAENSTSPILFEIKGEIERHVADELHVLSDDMYTLLKWKNFSDVNILMEGSPSLKVHSSIICARSLIPIGLLDNFAALGHFGSIVWRSFVLYLYTGQKRYLADHMLDIYFAACKYQLKETKKKYSKILANNLTERNVDDILFIAKGFGDTCLVKTAMCYRAKFIVD